MASDPITSWQIEGFSFLWKVEAVTDFLILGSKFTADGDLDEIRRQLLLGRETMTNLDSMLKSKDITFMTNVHIVKAIIFPVIMLWLWELDLNKGRALKNWCFWTVVLEKTLESPLDCKELQSVKPNGNQPWIFMHWKDGCWSWSSNTLASWCENLSHWKRPRGWERLKADGEGNNRGWDGWMASLTPWMWVWGSSGRWWRTGKPGVLQCMMGSQRVGHDQAIDNHQHPWDKIF